ncbi:hypothetical protein D3C75_1204620 [compost metagenome]
MVINTIYKAAKSEVKYHFGKWTFNTVGLDRCCICMFDCVNHKAFTCCVGEVIISVRVASNVNLRG